MILRDTTGQRFDCHGCTNCCREPVVHLLESDRRRLDARPWAEILGIQPYVRLGDAWVLNKRPDGRCAFLEDDGRCRLHREFGRSEKPLACQMFPFTLIRGEKELRMGWRFDCPTIARSVGRPVHKHENDVRKLAKSLEGGLVEPIPRGGGEQDSEWMSAEGIIRSAEKVLSQTALPAARRVRMLVTFAGIIAEPLFGGGDLEAFAGLVESVGGALGEVKHRELPPPTNRQKALLRVAVFAHCEQVTLEAARSAFQRIAIRFGQLSRARRFRKGRGAVPALTAGAGEVTFDQVEGTTISPEEERAVAELVLRYLRATIENHAFYGPAYYRWDPATGLAALCLRLPAIGWLARYVAAASGRDVVSFEDVVAAVGRVDQSAGRVRSLGSPAERLRLRYLLRDQGLMRLLEAYRLHAN